LAAIADGELGDTAALDASIVEFAAAFAAKE
jgi:hypothetical protein